MPKSDLHINENRWRHRRMFLERRALPVLRLEVILPVLAVRALPGRWLEVPPVGPTAKGAS